MKNKSLYSFNLDVVITGKPQVDVMEAEKDPEGATNKAVKGLAALLKVHINWRILQEPDPT